MRVCVTGATGFVGAQVARMLAADGHEVRTVYRDPGRLTRLTGVAHDPIRADVLNPAELAEAFAGAEVVFHAAGYVAARPPSRVWQLNAVSPSVAVEAAARSGARRLVLTSTVAAIGPPEPGAIGDESTPYRGDGLRLGYRDAKRAGEIAAFQAGERVGIEVVAVNPSYVLGVPVAPGFADANSTRIVGHFLRGRLPAIVHGHVNLVDVQDVAAGHLAAAARGRPGERYILGGHNRRWLDLIDRIGELSGVRRPVVVLPPETAVIVRTAETVGLPVPIAHDAFTGMAQNWRYSSQKAARELGYATRPLDDTLIETIDWYRKLIAAGAFADEQRSFMSLTAAGLRVGGRLGLGPIVRRSQRAIGRRLVAGV